MKEYKEEKLFINYKHKHILIREQLVIIIEDVIKYIRNLFITFKLKNNI